MGTVSKQKEDGSWKHRPIQDLRRNRVEGTKEWDEDATRASDGASLAFVPSFTGQ